MGFWNPALVWLDCQFCYRQARFSSPRPPLAFTLSAAVVLLCLSPPLAPVHASYLLDTNVLNIVHIPKTGGSSVNGFLRRFESIRLCNRTPCCHYRQFQMELAAADFSSCNTVTYESDHSVIAYIEDMVASAPSSNGNNMSSSSSPQGQSGIDVGTGGGGSGDGSTRHKVVHAVVFRRPLDHVLSQGKHDVKAGRIAAVEDKWRSRSHRKQLQQENQGDDTTQATDKGHGYNPQNLQTRKFGGLNATMDFIDSALAVGVSEYLEQFLVVLQYKLLQSLDDNGEGEGGSKSDSKSDPGILHHDMSSRRAARQKKRANEKIARQRQQLLSRPLPCFKPFIDPANLANKIDRPYTLDAVDIAKIRELTWEDEIAYAHALARLYSDYNEVREVAWGRSRWVTYDRYRDLFLFEFGMGRKETGDRSIWAEM